MEDHHERRNRPRLDVRGARAAIGWTVLRR
jgi:hypothetical protein